MFEFETTNIEGMFIIKPFVYEDNRGILRKVYEKEEFRKKGIDFAVCEELMTTSKRGILRGLHFQTQHGQGKLIRLACGSLQDVAVDVRPNSPTFGASCSVDMTIENKKMVYLPSGIAHGCLALEDETTFFYMCTQPYLPGFDSGIFWNDPSLNISWRIPTRDIIVSEKDANLPHFSEYKSKIKRR